MKLKNSSYIGFSIKKTKDSTKTNYSVEKCIGEIYNKDIQNEVKELRKSICEDHNIKSCKEASDSRNELNDIFNNKDKYHSKINELILDKIECVGEYIVNNVFPKLDYKIYECIDGKLEDMNIDTYELYEFPEAYLTNKGEERTAVKLFYRLIINKTDCQKIFRVETRTKGNWFSGSIQFQMYDIDNV